MKETKLEIPADYEVDKVETQDGHIVVTFKKIERLLPKSWKEFCDIFPIKDGESYIQSTGEIEVYLYNRIISRYVKDKNILPDRATAEAVLALCQLIQLRNCYNGDWMPDYKTADTKFTIEFDNNRIVKNTTKGWPCILIFKTEELRNEFLRNFRPLIEKLKPLYGIKKNDNQ